MNKPKGAQSKTDKTKPILSKLVTKYETYQSPEFRHRKSFYTNKSTVTPPLRARSEFHTHPRAPGNTENIHESVEKCGEVCVFGDAGSGAAHGVCRGTREWTAGLAIPASRSLPPRAARRACQLSSPSAAIQLR